MEESVGSLSKIDLETGEIDSERESEVDFTHSRPRSVFRSSSRTDLENGKLRSETDE